MRLITNESRFTESLRQLGKLLSAEITDCLHTKLHLSAGNTRSLGEKVAGDVLDILTGRRQLSGQHADISPGLAFATTENRSTLIVPDSTAFSLRIHEATYDESQSRLVAALIQTIVKTIKDNHQVEMEDAVSAVRDVTFTVACLLEGAQENNGEDSRIWPHLVFIDGQKQRSLVSVASGSWMHEYVHTCCDTVF